MRILLASILFMVSPGLWAQLVEPVQWQARSESLGHGRHKLIFEATIDPGWYLYATEVPPGGPLPTTFTIETQGGFEPVGGVQSLGTRITKFDRVFNMEVSAYLGHARFEQVVQLTPGSALTALSGFIAFQACHQDQCIYRERDFTLTLQGGATPTPTPAAAGAPETASAPAATPGEADRGLLLFFLIAFGAGLAGLLTPCVFPMVPLTVSFFLRKQGNRARAVAHAALFGLSIVGIYTLLGVLVAIAGLGAGFTNELVSHWLPNTIFFLLFVAFAASFFGVFELRLPASLSTRTDSQADRGGVLGTFFMALTLVIVSLSCVGPIVGVLLVEAATGTGARAVVGMSGFALALALPFTLFALFPSWLQRLPKSGGWLQSVKVVLGFITLALSLRFVATVDSTYHLNLLGREVFLALWIALFLLLALYLLGKIRFGHEAPLESLGFGRMLLALASLAFVVYLIPGMFGAPLTRIAGLIPSRQGHSFDLLQSRTALPASPTSLCDEPRFADILTLPHGLQGYFHYQQALDCAREQGKPLLIDFGGHGCANCKVMKERVWSDPRVLQRLNDHFIIAALYVDERTRLPEEEWVVSPLDGQVKNTLGRLNAHIQITQFGINSQPFTVIVDHDGNPLGPPHGFNTDVEAFIAFLDNAHSRFQSPIIQPQFSF